MQVLINSSAASIFQKVRENIRVMAAIFNLFSLNYDLVCHPDIYKTAFSNHFVFNILDNNNNNNNKFFYSAHTVLCALYTIEGRRYRKDASSRRF